MIALVSVHHISLNPTRLTNLYSPLIKKFRTRTVLACAVLFFAVMVSTASALSRLFVIPDISATRLPFS